MRLSTEPHTQCVDFCWRPVGRGVLLLPWLEQSHSWTLKAAIERLSEELYFVYYQRTQPLFKAPLLRYNTMSWCGSKCRTMTSTMQDWLAQQQHPLDEILRAWHHFVQLSRWTSNGKKEYSQDEEQILKAIGILLIDAYLWWVVRDKLLFIGAEYVDYALQIETKSDSEKAFFHAILHFILSHPFHLPPALLYFQWMGNRRSPFASRTIIQTYLQSLLVLPTELPYWIHLLIFASSGLPLIHICWPASMISSNYLVLTALPVYPFSSYGSSVDVMRHLPSYIPFLASFVADSKAIGTDSDLPSFLLSMIFQNTVSQMDLQYIVNMQLLIKDGIRIHVLSPLAHHTRLTVIRNLKACILLQHGYSYSLLQVIRDFLRLPRPPGNFFVLKASMAIPVRSLHTHAHFVIEPVLLDTMLPLLAVTEHERTKERLSEVVSVKTPPVSPLAESVSAASFKERNPKTETTPKEIPAHSTGNIMELQCANAPSTIQLRAVGTTVTLRASLTSETGAVRKASSQSSPAQKSHGSTISSVQTFGNLQYSTCTFNYNANVFLDSRAASVLYLVACTESCHLDLHLAGVLSERFDNDSIATGGGYAFDFESGRLYSVETHNIESILMKSSEIPNLLGRRFQTLPGNACAFYMSMSPHEISWGAQKSVKARLEVPAVPTDMWVKSNFFVILGIRNSSSVEILVFDHDEFDPSHSCLRFHSCVVPSGQLAPRHLHSNFYTRSNLSRDVLKKLLRPTKCKSAESDKSQERSLPPRLAPVPEYLPGSLSGIHVATIKKSPAGFASVQPTLRRRRGRPPKKQVLAATSEPRRNCPQEAERAVANVLLQSRLQLRRLLDLHWFPVSCPSCKLDALDLSGLPGTCTSATDILPSPARTRRSQLQRLQSIPSPALGNRSMRLWEIAPVRMDFGAPGRLNRYRYSTIIDRR